jgi:transcription elongation factor Elf1
MSGRLTKLLRRSPRPSWLACQACGSRYVCPLDWAPVDEQTWWVACRCGECGHRHEVSLSNDQAASWDVELCRQTAVIEREFARLDRARMAAEAATFTAALRHDLIDATDFA